jgi:hypothetical protein
MKKIIEVFVVLLLFCTLVGLVSAEKPTITATIEPGANWPLHAGDSFRILFNFTPKMIGTPEEPISAVVWRVVVETHAPYLHIWPSDPCGVDHYGDHYIDCEGVNPMGGSGPNPFTLWVFADETTPPSGVNTHIDINGYYIGPVEGPHYQGDQPDPVTLQIPGVSSQVPEFPSSVLPVIFIIGFLGAVLLIQRTREN